MSGSSEMLDYKPLKPLTDGDRLSVAEQAQRLAKDEREQEMFLRMLGLR